MNYSMSETNEAFIAGGTHEEKATADSQRISGG